MHPRNIKYSHQLVPSNKETHRIFEDTHILLERKKNKVAGRTEESRVRLYKKLGRKENV